MTLGQVLGLILSDFDQETIVGSPAELDKDGNEIKPDTTHRRAIWIEKGIEFPVPKTKEDEGSMAEE